MVQQKKVIQQSEHTNIAEAHTPDEIPGWRTFLIKRLINIKSTPEGLNTRPNPIKDKDNFSMIGKVCLYQIKKR